MKNDMDLNMIIFPEVGSCSFMPGKHNYGSTHKDWPACYETI